MRELVWISSFNSVKIDEIYRGLTQLLLFSLENLNLYWFWHRVRAIYQKTFWEGSESNLSSPPDPPCPGVATIELLFFIWGAYLRNLEKSLAARGKFNENHKNSQGSRCARSPIPCSDPIINYYGAFIQIRAILWKVMKLYNYTLRISSNSLKSFYIRGGSASEPPILACKY